MALIKAANSDDNINKILCMRSIICDACKEYNTYALLRKKEN